jgi:hypothetical protein
MKWNVPFYPFLISIYSALAIYANGAGAVLFTDVINTLAACLLFGSATFVMWRVVLGDWHRAGIFSAITLFFLFAYSYAVYFAVSLGGLDLTIFDVVWGLAFIGLLFLAWRQYSEPSKLTFLLNIVAVVLVAMPLFKLALFAWQNPLDSGALAAETGVVLPESPAAGEPTPSIFYLIFDRYADARTLQSVYSYANNAFLTQLRERGFYVAGRSVANYPKTAHSLASSLNMDYLTDLEGRYGRKSRDWRPLFLKLRNFELLRVLRQVGYHYVHLGSWWAGTHRNPLADENFVEGALLDTLNSFERLLFTSTAIARTVPANIRPLSNESQCRRVRQKLAAIRRAAKGDQPVFVFAHMLVPHDPYVFDADGHCLGDDEADARSERDNYVGQVEFVNKQLLLLIDDLIRSATPAPIIIVQSDEGPFPPRYQADLDGFDWNTATTAELRQKMGILNAYYLPGVDDGALYPTITPVNSFRVVLREYLGLTLPLLPDRNYVFRDAEHLYDFTDVTERVR